METKKISRFNHPSIGIIGMWVIAAASLFDRKISLYIIFPTIAVMLVAIFFKMKREKAEGVFDKSKYITGGLIILFSIGMFIFFRFFKI